MRGTCAYAFCPGVMITEDDESGRTAPAGKKYGAQRRLRAQLPERDVRNNNRLMKNKMRDARKMRRRMGMINVQWI